MPAAAAMQAQADNERLEFLGDSILGWLVSEWLFARFRDFTEGQLSLLKNHLVSATHLLAAAHRLDLGRYLQLGRGEETAGGRGKQRLLVNAFEAVLAAVYLDGGADPARDLLARYVMPRMKNSPNSPVPGRRTISARNWNVSRGIENYRGLCIFW